MNIQENYVQTIADFKVAYGNLGLSVTPKVHYVVVHVPEWIERSEERTGQKRGLGWASEQASESVHRDFAQKWNLGFKVHPDNERYADRLLSCVVRYNSSHV